MLALLPAACRLPPCCSALHCTALQSAPSGSGGQHHPYPTLPARLPHASLVGDMNWIGNEQASPFPPQRPARPGSQLPARPCWQDVWLALRDIQSDRGNTWDPSVCAQKGLWSGSKVCRSAAQRCRCRRSGTALLKACTSARSRSSPHSKSANLPLVLLIHCSAEPPRPPVLPAGGLGASDHRAHCRQGVWVDGPPPPPALLTHTRTHAGGAAAARGRSCSRAPVHRTLTSSTRCIVNANPPPACSPFRG